MITVTRWTRYLQRAAELDAEIASGKTIDQIMRERQLARGKARIEEILRQDAEGRVMNCANCYEPIRPTEERDGIEMHDGEYEYGWVHDYGPEAAGNPSCDIHPVATPPGYRRTS